MKKSSYKAILLFYVVLFLFFLFLLIFCSFFQIFLSLDLLTFSFPFSIQGFPLPLPSRAASFSSLSPPPILPILPYIFLLFRLFLQHYLVPFLVFPNDQLRSRYQAALEGWGEFVCVLVWRLNSCVDYQRILGKCHVTILKIRSPR